MKFFFYILFLLLSFGVYSREIVVTSFYKYPVNVQYAEKLSGSELLTFELRNNELTINNQSRQTGKILIIKEDGASEVVTIKGISSNQANQIKNRMSKIAQKKKKYNNVKIAGYGTTESQKKITKYTQVITSRNELSPNTYLNSSVKYETFSNKKPSYYNIFYDSRYIDFEYGYLSYLGLNGLIGFGTGINFNNSNRLNLLRGKYSDDMWIDELKYNFNNNLIFTVDYNEKNKNTIPVAQTYFTNDYIRSSATYSYFKDVDGKESNNLNFNIDLVKKNKIIKKITYQKEYIESGNLSIYNDKMTTTQVNTDQLDAQLELYSKSKGRGELRLYNNYTYKYDEIYRQDDYNILLGTEFEYDKKIITAFDVALDSEKTVVYGMRMTALVDNHNTLNINSNINDRYSLYNFSHIYNKTNINNVFSISRNKYDQVLYYTISDYLSYYIGSKNKITLKTSLGMNEGTNNAGISNGQIGLGYAYISPKYSIGLNDTFSMYRRYGKNLKNNLVGFNYSYNFDFGNDALLAKQVKKHNMRFELYIDKNLNHSQDLDENVINPADVKLILINAESKEQFTGTLSANQLFINSIPEGDYLVSIDSKYKSKMTNLTIDSSKTMTIPLYDSKKIRLNLYNESNKDFIQDYISYNILCDSGYKKSESVLIDSISEIEIPNEKCVINEFDNINSRNDFIFISKEIKINEENEYNIKIFASNKLLIYLTLLDNSEKNLKNYSFSVDFNRKYIFNKSETLISNITGFNKTVKFSSLFKYEKKKLDCQFNDFVIDFNAREYKKYKTEIFCSLLKK